MSMTLEKAIARCGKIVKEAKKSYEVHVGDIMAEVGMELTKKGIEEYQQYAEWLRELQERRKQPEIIYCGECELKIECCRNIRSGGRKDDDFCSCGRRAERRTDD